jgi:hypothetical protein
MTTPINLTQLRAAIEEAARLGDGGVEMEATHNALASDHPNPYTPPQPSNLTAGGSA